MAYQIEEIMWVILITISIIVALAVMEQRKFTKASPQIKTCKTANIEPIVSTENDLVEIVVEYGHTMPTPTALLLAAYRELQGDSKKYRKIGSIKGPQSRTFYFAER